MENNVIKKSKLIIKMFLDRLLLAGIYAKGIWIRKIKHRKCTFFLETPLHGNIGDQAITYAEQCVIKQYGDSYFFEIPFDCLGRKYLQPRKWKHLIGKQKLYIHGGGFLGTLWIEADSVFRKILKVFHDNEIVVFPQTIFFDNKSDDLINEYRELFQNCKQVTLFTREIYSYQKMLEYNFPNVTVKLMPDMVTYLTPEYFRGLKRYVNSPKKALLCMRKDHEAILSGAERGGILEALKGYEIAKTDTVVPHFILPFYRKKEIKKKLAEFAAADLIVTDRLHGMVLAAIAQTPCVAFNNCSDKVKGVYEWIKPNKYVQFIDNPNELEKKIEEVASQKERTYHNEHLLPYFEELKKYL